MTLTLQEMSDRFEIQDLIVGYCYAVDTRDWDTLDRYFTDDAVIDYSEMVGVVGSLADIKAFLSASLTPILAFQHAVSTTQYQIAGDRAQTKTACYNPMTVSNGETTDTLVFGLWYHHDFVRTAQGWKISRLYEQKCYRMNVPDWLAAQLPA
ncbi:MAG: nuclear transport factor 2 family protein [Sphingobium sp.]|jgi:ketosteroid isomerase-like protein|uniref:Nuclear transport factor 2 family protein n=2 Tax=Sphingobium TaxID=165695 RepID=A0A249MXB4_SPHXE|nr:MULTISPECIES: nuclear transport factor 2 family protein [Sphingobium]MBU0660475.1 nuclear transport factor 2 family protein [Alphaproteobacteria bacterium]ASY45966.1 nuclear transport factor 2 family protein [Sphingobium xenophagum]MBA4755483.1 nuclear transport factor 2 family protein [Sphingobium sp.]MBS91327.1 nuclear transport factor 2 family protein [Sphingobium sp.]MBU0774672.1 nuclear transport factor 2 family protein [Alphaproteobacteria bacterium]|tara:strand:- start:472 stop:927 length:456 start_codon:yes stop_codon:yes gene_type:complete